MFNFSLMEYQLDEALERYNRNSSRDREIALLKAELREEQKAASLRRRFAAAIVGFALKLDPEAVNVAPLRMTLGAANVRD
jgi:hypothetical protein